MDTEALASFWQRLAVEVEKLPTDQLLSRPAGVPMITEAPPGISAIRITQAAYQSGCSDFLEKGTDGPSIPEDATESHSYVLWQYYWYGYWYTASVTGKPKTKAPDIKDPESYRGDKNAFENFVTQLALKFSSDPDRFNADESKISYAGSFLRGPAYDWFRPHVDRLTGKTTFMNYEAFIIALGSAWDDPDAIATAERKLLNLKQGNEPCSVYHAKFSSLMAILKWDTPAQVSHFKRGLRDELKDLLVSIPDQPTTFDDYVKLCIKLDNRWHARYLERKPHQPKNSNGSEKKSSSQQTQAPKSASSQSTMPSTASGTHPGPMDLSTAKYQRLSKEEKSRRYKEGLCAYCDEKGHFVMACPKKKKKSLPPQKQSVASASSSSSTTIPIPSGKSESGETLYSVSDQASKNE